MRWWVRASYLEPPFTFGAFLRYIGRHLPGDIEGAIVAARITTVKELEEVLIKLQGMEDRKHEEQRRQPEYDREKRRDPVKENEGRMKEWICPERNCGCSNYEDRTKCRQCNIERRKVREGGGRVMYQRTVYNQGGGGRNRNVETRGGMNGSYNVQNQENNQRRMILDHQIASTSRGNTEN